MSDDVPKVDHVCLRNSRLHPVVAAAEKPSLDGLWETWSRCDAKNHKATLAPTKMRPTATRERERESLTVGVLLWP